MIKLFERLLWPFNMIYMITNSGTLYEENSILLFVSSLRQIS